jgi:hypothetical protein
MTEEEFKNLNVGDKITMVLDFYHRSYTITRKNLSGYSVINDQPYQDGRPIEGEASQADLWELVSKVPTTRPDLINRRLDTEL